MNADARITAVLPEMLEDEYFALVHLSVTDLDQLAGSWRARVPGSDKTAIAVAEALKSVALKRRATTAVRIRIKAVSSVWPPLRKLARWALLRG